MKCNVLLTWYNRKGSYELFKSYCFSLFLIKSPKQRLETYCFCSVSYYYYFFYYYYYSSFFPRDMHVSAADLRNYCTEFHET